MVFLSVISAVHSHIMSLFNVALKNISLAVSCPCSVFCTGMGSHNGHCGHIACQYVSVVPLVVIIKLLTVSTMRDLIRALGCLRC